MSGRGSTALLPPSSTKWDGAMLVKSTHQMRAVRGSQRCLPACYACNTFPPIFKKKKTHTNIFIFWLARGISVSRRQGLKHHRWTTCPVTFYAGDGCCVMKKRMSRDVAGISQASSLKLLTAVRDGKQETHQRISLLNTEWHAKMHKDAQGLE